MPRRCFAIVLVLLLPVACRDAGRESESEQPRAGGTLVFGTDDQYPDCLNPIVTECTALEWLQMAVLRPTMARLLELDSNNEYVASDLVKELPSLANGGVTKDPFTVTYELNPKAVWEDGSPITGYDVKFTWEAERMLEASHPVKDVVAGEHTVTLKFSEPYAAWKGLLRYILKKEAFAGRPDGVAAMLDDLPFSGGPFKLQSYTKSEIVLVRNERYYGKRRPFLAKVIYRKLNPSEQVRAFSDGEIQAFYPQPATDLSQLSVAVPEARMAVKRGSLVEGLWFNLDAFPINDVRVREALLYGLDRQKAIEDTVGAIDPDATVNRCLWSVPDLAGGKWCNADFPPERDVDEARRALEAAGWSKGPDGIYRKGSQRLVIPLATTTGNKIREHFQQLLQEQAREVGIDLRSDNTDASTLINDRLHNRTFVVAMFSWSLLPDPGVTEELAADMIPDSRNPNGRNYYGWRNDEAHRRLHQSDREIDEGRRRRIFAELGRLMRQDIISIPLYQRPQILVWNGAKLGGDFDFSSVHGFSSRLSTWYIK